MVVVNTSSLSSLWVKHYFSPLFRASPVREEGVMVAVEEELGTKTMRFLPSHPQTMPTPLCCTSWSTSPVIPSILCLTMVCLTPTPILSCLLSWCPICWVRTLTSSLGLCTQWVHPSVFLFFFYVWPWIIVQLLVSLNQTTGSQPETHCKGRFVVRYQTLAIENSFCAEAIIRAKHVVFFL